MKLVRKRKRETESQAKQKKNKKKKDINGQGGPNSTNMLMIIN